MIFRYISNKKICCCYFIFTQKIFSKFFPIKFSRLIFDRQIYILSINKSKILFHISENNINNQIRIYYINSLFIINISKIQLTFIVLTEIFKKSQQKSLALSPLHFLQLYSWIIILQNLFKRPSFIG